MFLRIWSLSRSVVAALLMIRNSSGPVRVTVTSDSYVPRSLSIPVYTDVPILTATSAVHSHCSAASAPGPTSRYFENEVWSKTATFVRVLACSAADHGNQLGLSQVYSIVGSASPGAKKFARSQPILLPKLAPAASSKWCTGERRNGRAVVISRLGHGIS